MGILWVFYTSLLLWKAKFLFLPMVLINAALRGAARVRGPLQGCLSSLSCSSQSNSKTRYAQFCHPLQKGRQMHRKQF